MNVSEVLHLQLEPDRARFDLLYSHKTYFTVSGSNLLHLKVIL
jgi:hypothetical protein